MAIHYFYTFPCPKNPKPTFLNSSLIWIYNLVKENMLAQCSHQAAALRDSRKKN